MGRYKPPTSPAEAAERLAARTAKLEQLHATLAEQVIALRDGQDWQRWLDVAAKFPSYSLNNLLLIAAQRPDATAVAGFGAWKALGRQVDKGSKGIAILAPMVRRPKAGASGSQTTAAVSLGRTGHTGDLSDRTAGARRGVLGFMAVHVFDVSQTFGDPLPERPVPVLLTGRAPQGLWEALAAQVAACDFELKRGDCGGANGLTHYTARTVTVRADVDDAQAVKTLAHELGHVLLHDPAAPTRVPPFLAAPDPALTIWDPVLIPETVDTSAGQCSGRLEVEAESVAYLIASAHGLDTGAYTFPYVAGWASSVDGARVDQVVRSTANRVLAASAIVLAGTDHLLVAQTGTGQVLEQAQGAAAWGAERTAALLTAARVTTGSARQLLAAATPPPVTGSVSVPPAVALAAGAATVADGPTPERLMEVHALAVDFYAVRLHAGGPDADRAVALLSARGVGSRTAGAARLGYAPRAWTTLVDHLRQNGVDDATLHGSGLVLQSSRGTLVDRFRDRVIFPVDTVDGQTVALLGRAVDDSATDRRGAPIPKYLNSPNTVLYSKGEHLYGLGPMAAEAVAIGAQPVMVEGPMDVLAINRVAASSPGNRPAHFGVAPCGTALTGQQVQLLDTLTGGLAERGFVTAFDGDDAGRRASLRVYELLRDVGAWPHTMDLPDGQDPASLAAEHGTVGLEAALLAAGGKPLADVVVDERIARHHLKWTEGQVAAARGAAELVAEMPPEHVTRQIVRIAARTGLDAQTVSGLVVAAATNPTRRHDTGDTDDRSTRTEPSRPAPASPGPTTGPPPPMRAVSGSLGHSPAQRARAGFPIALSGSPLPPSSAILSNPAVRPTPARR